MGTEGRSPGRELPASNDVYESVVFKSADIEDLKILEPPAQPQPPQPKAPFVDPAIVSKGKVAPNIPASTGLGSGEPQEMSAGGWPAAPRLQFGTATTTTVRPTAPSVQSQPTASFGSLKPSAIASSTVSAPSPATLPTPKPVFGTVNKETAPVPKPALTITSSKPNFASAVASSQVPTASSNIRSSPAKATAPNGKAAPEKVMSYSTGTGKVELVQKEKTRSYASVLSDGAGRFRRVEQSNTTEMVPPAEFDFEQNNAKLFQDPALIEFAKSTEGQIFYDKSSSFFDNISSEATAHSKDPQLPNERKWNIETFGVAQPHRSYSSYGHRGGRGSGNYRGRGRGRGGYRGGYQQQADR